MRSTKKSPGARRVPLAKEAKGAGDKVTRLDDMDVEEVSAVPKGANRQKFVVVKSDGTEADKPSAIEGVMERVLKLADGGLDKEATVTVAKEAIALLEEHAGEGAKTHSAGPALPLILKSLEGIASTLERISKTEVAKADGAAEVREALTKADVDGLQGKITELASIVAKQAEGILAIAKRIAKVEAFPTDGHSVMEKSQGAAPKGVPWKADLASE